MHRALKPFFTDVFADHLFIHGIRRSCQDLA
jgi:hypothetical protein